MGPLCKVCGKPVPKQTRSLSFTPAALNGRQNGERGKHTIYLDEDQRPRSVEEAQRYSNQPILSVKRYGTPTIHSMNTWDGESYVWGGHFHAQGCAAQFGQAMAENFPDYSMKAFKEAMAAREAKEQPA